MYHLSYSSLKFGPICFLQLTENRKIHNAWHTHDWQSACKQSWTYKHRYNARYPDRWSEKFKKTRLIKKERERERERERGGGTDRDRERGGDWKIDRQTNGDRRRDRGRRQSRRDRQTRIARGQSLEIEISGLALCSPPLSLFLSLSLSLSLCLCLSPSLSLPLSLPLSLSLSLCVSLSLSLSLCLSLPLSLSLSLSPSLSLSLSLSRPTTIEQDHFAHQWSVVLMRASLCCGNQVE